MSDLSGLHGVFAPSLRRNAEEGFLSVSVFNPETGQREPKEIDLGPAATFSRKSASGATPPIRRLKSSALATAPAAWIIHGRRPAIRAILWRS